MAILWEVRLGEPCLAAFCRLITKQGKGRWILFPWSALKPTELPSPPQGTLNVVHACTREKWDAQQLSSMVAQDPVLSVEILRIANSAYFGFASEITSVARAITVIGQNALR